MTKPNFQKGTDWWAVAMMFEGREVLDKTCKLWRWRDRFERCFGDEWHYDNIPTLMYMDGWTLPEKWIPCGILEAREKKMAGFDVRHRESGDSVAVIGGVLSWVTFNAVGVGDGTAAPDAFEYLEGSGDE